MKVYSPLVGIALATVVVNGDSNSFRAGLNQRILSTTTYPDSLSVISNTDSYHMRPVRVVQARVQGDTPLWNDTTGMFGSKYYSTAETQYRGAMDTVNTASVEGALMYVQAECINYNTRAAADRCSRKNNAKNVVFYEIVFAQTNETLAYYNDEYGPMLPMDGGRCTPSSSSNGVDVFPDECYFFNGTSTKPALGPFVGGGAKDTDPRAPYPNTWWYSFPNSCPLSTWSSGNKTDACRAATRRGLCDSGVMPDGITCTYNYRILGYVTVDDLVGITSMTSNVTNTNYANFSQFCQEGGVEFNATEQGVWFQSIDFWKNPQNSSANSERATKLVQLYNDIQSKTKTSTQISSSVIDHFLPLPTIASLTAANPKCYLNSKKCALAKYGCKRQLYGQICTVCSVSDTGCDVAPGNFTYPTLTYSTSTSTFSNANYTPAPSSTPSTSTTPSPTTTTTPSPSSASTLRMMTIASVAATIALTFVM